MGTAEVLEGMAVMQSALANWGEAAYLHGAAEALREKIGGLVLQSTFSCIPDIGADLFPWLPVRWMASIKYSTCEKLPRIKVPVLVMHSRTDALIRFRHAEKNFARANEPKLMWELQGDHNESVMDEQHFIAGIEKFLKMIETRRGSQSVQRPEH